MSGQHGALFKDDRMTNSPQQPTDLPRNCTFEEQDWHKLAQYWYPVALSSEVVQAPLAARLLDEPLVLYRVHGGLVVARDICPHRGVPLSMGRATADGGSIACAYHGLHFGAEGKCIHIPAEPDRAVPARLHLHTYPSVERYGLVWTCLLPTSAAPCIPPMPHWDESEFQQINCPAIDIAGFAGRQVEGFLDVAHFGFVHQATFGNPDNAVVPAYTPVRTEDGFEVEYRSTVGNYPIGAGAVIPPGFVWLRHFRLHLPFTATLTIHFPNAGRLVVMNAASPVSARLTRMFAPIARNFDKDLPLEAVYDFNRRVFEEDRAIVEAQRPECLPLDPMMEAHILADRSSLAYRRGLRDLGFSRFFIA
jgi:vanillate O-demethylase monooxygenase subunit